MFKYPYSKNLWKNYINDFIQKYKGSKMESIRDIFERALTQVPKTDSLQIYLRFAETERKFGTLYSSQNIYERAARAVPKDQRLSVFESYLQAQMSLGLAKVRDVFERAIEAPEPYELREEDVVNLCLRYAQMECDEGEIKRAR